MKDKPLGFQIWIIITGFVMIIAVVMAVVISFAINKFFTNETYEMLINSQQISIKALTTDLYIKILKILIVVSIVNITIAKFIANKITAPLRYLEKKVRKISNKEWADPIDLYRGDEIGKLAVSINAMQESLKAKDQEEQIFLQTVSHDLKTPVMVIRSYAQAILDGIYLNNSLQDTVHIIEKEAKNLEKKVEKLLYLNSLDYIMKRKNEFNQVNIKEILENILSRLSFKQKNIYIEKHMDTIYILGNYEELTIAFENILENNIRYAKSTIIISVKTINDEQIQLSFQNDGPPIDKSIIDNLFHRFYKGKNGHFGLGLFITKKIIDFHKGEISAQNGADGVKFIIVLPNKKCN